jgi:hypothetical protein
VRAVTLTQGIPLFENMPWKTLVSLSVIVAVLLATADFVTGWLQKRESIKWQEMQFLMSKDSNDAITQMHDMLSKICDAADDMVETFLASEGYVTHPSTKKENSKSKK